MLLQVNWLPYGYHPAYKAPVTYYTGCIRYRKIIEPYMPDRVTRQVGLIQTIPRDPIRPDVACRAVSVKQYKVKFSPQATKDWENFIACEQHSLRTAGKQKLTSSDSLTCTNDYFQWFVTHSHPFINPDVDQIIALPERTNTDYVSI